MYVPLIVALAEGRYGTGSGWNEEFRGHGQMSGVLAHVPGQFSGILLFRLKNGCAQDEANKHFGLGAGFDDCVFVGPALDLFTYQASELAVTLELA
jgi:hypothetical protein